MLNYSVFWIEEEFYRHYFYRPEILYRFFNEWKENPGSAEYASQFNYITRMLPDAKVISHLCSMSSNSKQSRGNEWLVRSEKQQIKCKVADRTIQVNCEFYEQVENLLFQPLRHFNGSFFAMETSQGNYGWISAGRKRTPTLNHQLLYSFH